MNELLRKASSHLTGQEEISEVNADELERLTKEHPFFSVSHVLLAKKYKSDSHSGFLPQVQKAALFFNNPNWLHYQLLDAETDLSITEEIGAHEISPVTKQALPEQLPLPEETAPSHIYSKHEIFAASNLAKETLAAEENTVVAGEGEDEIALDEMHPEKEEILEEIQEQSIGDGTPTLEDEKELSADEGVSTYQQVEEPMKVSNEETQTHKDQVETVVENVLVQPIDIGEPIETKDEPVISGDDKPDFKSPLDKLSTATPPSNDESIIPIEPYYTVDYFASQGIKLTLDKNPQDKLGKQLRSFTDWLKHMKKLGPEDALKAPQETEVDPAVKDSADTSNTPKEIITEAMADVLIKQGKTQQAMEVYNKLSFLYPDKSPYFANQIQKLKGS